MNMTLAQLKQNARNRMDQGYPGGIGTVLRGALLYLLLTNWVSLLISLIQDNPLESLYNQMLDAISSGSSSALNGVLQTAPTLFQSPAAKITLFLSILVFLYTLVLEYGYSSYALALYRGGQPGYKELFSRFYMGGKVILLSLVIYVATYLWSLLFLIPGIVAWYRYRMSRYVLLDHPEMGIFTAWNHSKRMMQGHKSQLFLVDLSFLLWIVAAYAATNMAYYLLLTAGLPDTVAYLLSEVVFTAFYVYLTPYMELTVVGFYHMICPPELLPTQQSH